MFFDVPPRPLGPLMMGSTLAVLALLCLMAPARAQAQAETQKPALAADYIPDPGFLKQDPFRKTKQVIRLSGVKSDAELAVVRGAINEVVGFVRLFGITGSNLGQAAPSGIPPERVAEIKAARVTWKAFQDQSTARGRESMPIEPASGHMVMAMDQWQVESDTVLSVRTDFRMTAYELKMVKDPVPRILRLRFIRQEGRWLFDGVMGEER